MRRVDHDIKNADSSRRILQRECTFDSHGEAKWQREHSAALRLNAELLASGDVELGRAVEEANESSCAEVKALAGHQRCR